MSRDFYKHFNSKDFIEPCCNEKLKQKFDLSAEECREIHITPFKVTLDSKLRWLQYRINHGILVTNSWLFKVGISESNTCVYCDNIETIDHILTSCQVVNKFWDDVLINMSFMPDGLSDFNKIHGVLDIPNATLINQLLIIIRQCIYFCKHKLP